MLSGRETTRLSPALAAGDDLPTATAGAPRARAEGTPAGQQEDLQLVNRELRQELARAQAELSELRKTTAAATTAQGTPQSAEWFRLIFDRTPVGISLVDAQERIIQANPRLADMMGYTCQEMAGRTVREITHPDFMAAKERRIAQLNAGEVDHYTLEEKCLCRDGHELWVRITSSMVTDEHTGERLRMNIVEDIQQERQALLDAEDARIKLHQVTSAMPGGVYEYVRTAEGKSVMTFASEGVATLLGVTRELLLEDIRHTYTHIIPEDVAEMQRTMEASRQNITPWRGEFRVRHPGGRVAWVQSQAVATAQADGSVVWRGQMMDITTRKEAEEQLRLAKEQTELATRARSEFLTSISHEIRTPMNAILGFSELLESEIQDSIHRQYLRSIRSAGTTLLDLINDFLDYSRMEAGKLELHEEPLSLPELLNDISGIFMIKTQHKGLEFWVDIDPRLPQRLVLDEMRLRQIFFNLVGNAVKFTRQGYVKIKVARVGRPSEDRLDLCIEVEDTGIGIDEPFHGKIFESFIQVSGNDKEFGGSGLGLAITKRIVEMMGGEISLSSALDQGSIFRVKLTGVRYHNPAVSSPEEEEDPFSYRVQEAPPEEPAAASGVMTYVPPHAPRAANQLKGTLILLAHEEDGVRALVRGYLRGTESVLREAATSQEAFSQMRREQPAVLIMNVEWLDEPESLFRQERAREAWAQAVPIVLYSKRRISKDELATLGWESVQVLRVPVSRASFLQALARALPERVVENGLSRDDDYQGDVSVAGFVASTDLLEQLDALDARCSERLSGAPEIDEIQAFAQRMLAVGREHAADPICTFAQRLLFAVGSFDVAEMNRLLKSFPILVRDLRHIG